jgi:reticulocyte binding protein (fragment)
VYIEAIFKDSGYRYQIEPSVRVNSIRKDNFGNAKRLEMFKDIIKAAGLEFSVSGKVVLITKKIGTDLSTVVRKNFNMNELVIEKNINKFITYKRGFGAWKDEEDHSKGRYTSEYESPLARIYGRIEGEPVTDERYKDTGKLIERLKFEVDNSYSISVQLDMEDLNRAGYQYTQPRAGDYIMAINETIGFREKIRIVSFESSYDVTGRLINHKVTCNDIGNVQKQISSESSIIRSVGQNKEYAESALAVATKALASADGKSTVYYGATKPKDEPIGTIRRGDILYLTAGEETEMYIWNGSEWELKKLKLNTTELEKEFDKVKKAAEQANAESKAAAEEALKKAGASEDLAKEAKKIADDNVRNLNAFKMSVQEERENLSDELKRYSREETESRITSVREAFTNRFVAKSTYLENVEGVNQRFETIKRDNEVKLADYKQGIDGRFANIASQMAGKVNNVDFQRVRETSQLYERILGGAENDISNNVSRLVMSNQIFQTEVGKYVTDDNNLIVNSMTMDKHTLVNANRNGVNVSVSEGVFTVKANRLTGYNFSGFTLPIYVKKIYRGETYTLGFKYRIREKVDTNFTFVIKNHKLNKALLSADIAKPQDEAGVEWWEFQKTFTVQEDFAFGEDTNYPFYIYIAKNGWIEFKEPILVRGSRTGPYKPSQFDDAYKMAEATRTQMTLLSNSWSVKTLNGPGDVLGAINLNPDGSVKINEGLISVGEKTYIKDGVIKKSMIGNAQIGTAHIGEIDASKANIINISAKNIITEGLTANIIRGGKLSSLNGATVFDLNNGLLNSIGKDSGIVINRGAFDFVDRNGRGVAGYSGFFRDNGSIYGGGVGSHEGYDFIISTKTGARQMLRFTDDNRMIVSGDMNIVSNSANSGEYVGIKLKRYNQGGGWCTAIVNSSGTSGIEFYDNGNVRLLHHRTYWEP